MASATRAEGRGEAKLQANLRRARQHVLIWTLDAGCV